MFWEGIAFRPLMTDQSRKQRRHFSMNAGQGLVCVILSLIWYHKKRVCKVPVIVVWTKTEALDAEKIIQLMDNGNSLSEATQQAPQKAWADFEKSVYRHFVKFKYPPKAFVIFRSKFYAYSCLTTANYVVQRCISLELIVMI